MDKKIAKLQKNLGGIRKLAGKAAMPQVMICASPIDDEIAIREAKKKGLKIFAIQDTNSNPDLVDFVIPANDDSVKSITLITTILADAIASAHGEKPLYAYKSNEEIILPEEQKPEKVEKIANTEERKPRTFVKKLTLNQKILRNLNKIIERECYVSRFKKIKELRERTNSGFLDVKNALEATNNDIEKAIEWLQEKGIVKAAKKAGRIAAEGIVRAVIKDNIAVVFELNSETDFVAKINYF